MQWILDNCKWFCRQNCYCLSMQQNLFGINCLKVAMLLGKAIFFSLFNLF